jgi:hypothetical protein
MIQLWLLPPVLPSLLHPLPSTQLARRGRSNNVWAFNAQQTAGINLVVLLSEFV